MGAGVLSLRTGDTMSRYDLTKHSLQVPKAIDDIDARLTALEGKMEDVLPGLTESDFPITQTVQTDSDDSQGLVEEVAKAQRPITHDAAKAKILKVADWLDRRMDEAGVLDDDADEVMAALRAEAET